MPKREKSPDLPEDAKYLVVHQPYPLNANFELDGDLIAFVLWAASVFGAKEGVLGVHHKPARATVLLEVDKRLPLGGMLGEHRWREFLKDPREEEVEIVSRVYYSVYRTLRDAQKDGWKRVQVEPQWFVEYKWDLVSGPIKHPYPASHWCPPLPEDITGKRIARPLPVAQKPPPPAQPALVPGSAEWVKAVEEGKPTGHSGRGRGKGKGRGRGGGLGGLGGAGGARGVPVKAAVRAGNKAAAQKALANPWNKMSASGAPVSYESAPAPTPLVSSTSSAGYPAPPGLTRRVNTAPPTASSSSAPLVPPGLTKIGQSLAAMQLSDNEDEEEESFVPFDGDDESDDDWDGSSTVRPYAPSVAPSEAIMKPPEEEHVNLWDAPVEVIKAEEKPKPEWMCPTHGKLCKKGICSDYAKKTRDDKRAGEAAEREKKALEAKERRKQRNKEKRKAKKAEAGGSPREQSGSEEEEEVKPTPRFRRREGTGRQ